MAIQSFELDPNAQSYTDDEIITKINNATTNITRASSVSAAARPIAALEVDTAELAAGAVTNAKLGALAVDTAQLAADAVDGTKLADDAVAIEHIGAGAVDNTAMASGAAKANLDAMADTARGYVQTDPTTGQFKVIAVQRSATGKLKVNYDDVAE